MSASSKSTPSRQQLHMLWPIETRPRLPSFDVPDSYEIHPLRAEENDGYLAVMQAAGFRHADAAFLATWRQIAFPRGIFVAVHRATGEVAATALSSHRPTALHPHGAELGWVAGLANHAGHGLGQAVCLAAMQRALDAGYDHLYLSTDDWRLAAIKVYLKLGFQPYLYMDDMAPRWQAVCKELDWPADIDTWIVAAAECWIRPDPEDRSDSDDISRYRPHQRWLPNRPHQGYSCSGDVDAFGDESLYHPSRVGTGQVTPTRVMAGETAPLELAFTVGDEAIPEGASITFVMRGQTPLGRDRPAFTLTASTEATLALQPWGIRIEQGCLQPGDSVRLQTPPFPWTPLAGRREFKIVITYPDNRPEHRLPAPLVIDIEPAPLERLEVTLPCTHNTGDGISARITTRDRFDNRVAVDGPLTLQMADHSATVYLRDGLADAPLSPSSTAITRVTAALLPGHDLRCNANVSLAVEGPSYYVGDLHCHDFLSEAEGYPDAVYRWAIEDRRLDFVSVVPQSHGWHDNETWTIVKYMNERYLDEGRFVPLLGFEWQHTGYGDKVVHYLGGDQPYLPVDDPRYRSAPKLYRALRESDALVISHHPCYPKGSWCSSTDFDAVETDVERLVEIWSMHGSSEGYNPDDRPFRKVEKDSLVMAALRGGIRLGFTGGSDTHSARPGGSIKEPLAYWGGLTGVWAEALTRRSLFEALYQRRTVALTGERIILRMTVNDAPMGSEINAADKADIHIQTWSPSPIARIEVIKKTVCLKTYDIGGDTADIAVSDVTGGPAFYHCRVTLANGHLAVCSPVWIG